MGDALVVHGAVLLRTHPTDAVAPLPAATIEAGADALTVTLTGSTLAADAHRLGILLVDEASGEPVSMGYGVATTQTVEGGVITGGTLQLDGAALPASTRVIVLADTVPIASEVITP